MTDNINVQEQEIIEQEVEQAKPTHPLIPLLTPAKQPEELDIPLSIVTDIILRILFNEGNVSLRRFGEIVKLELILLDSIMEKMQHDKLVEVSSTGNVGRFSYTYALTDEGARRSRDSFERSQYIGPVPVPIEKYNQAIALQTQQKLRVSADLVKQSLSHLILPSDFHRSIGPAVQEGSSLFLYGPPGNGKTTVAQAVARLIAGTEGIFVPYAVTVAGYIISVYDPIQFSFSHHPPHPEIAKLKDRDARWGLFERPAIMVGGELTMDALELRYDAVAKFYEAPLQFKANGGMLLIDDFGRQMISPSELLNRWIVPLESGFDFLRLRTGQSLQVPFRQLIIFSTNLDPTDLVDGAFMRRIQMKVNVDSPDVQMFVQIFAIMAKNLGIPVQKEAIAYLIQKWYKEPGRDFQAVHPRDILKTIKAICEYVGEPPHLTPQLIDEACRNYFVI